MHGMNVHMDFVKIWSNLLAANCNAPGTSVCALPTTYFMQGVHVFALANDVTSRLSTYNTSCTSSASSLSGESDESVCANPSTESFDTSFTPEAIESPFGQHETNDSDESDSDSEQFIDSDFKLHQGAAGEGEKSLETSSTSRKSQRRIQRIRYSREEYKCSSCPYTCTTEKAFVKHLRSCTCDKEANVEPQFSCAICGKDRSSEQLILAHMTKHREGKHFCCDLCAFRTLQLKKLIQHRRMHTGEKPHLCPFCTYRSARRDNLRSHVRRVHKKENLTCDTFTPQSMLLTPSVPKTSQQRQAQLSAVKPLKENCI